LIDASICGAKADDDTQLIVFDSSALKKQLPVFYQKAGFGLCYRTGRSVGFSLIEKHETEAVKCIFVVAAYVERPMPSSARWSLSLSAPFPPPYRQLSERRK
jgi:hypothetical protein